MLLSQLFLAAWSLRWSSRIEATTLNTDKNKLLDNFASVVNPLKRTCGSTRGRFLARNRASAIFAKFLPSPFPSPYFPIVTQPWAGARPELNLPNLSYFTGYRNKSTGNRMTDFRSTFFNESNWNTFRTSTRHYALRCAIEFDPVSPTTML